MKFSWRPEGNRTVNSTTRGAFFGRPEGSLCRGTVGNFPQWVATDIWVYPTKKGNPSHNERQKRYFREVSIDERNESFFINDKPLLNYTDIWEPSQTNIRKSL